MKTFWSFLLRAPLLLLATAMLVGAILGSLEHISSGDPKLIGAVVFAVWGFLLARNTIGDLKEALHAK